MVDVLDFVYVGVGIFGYFLDLFVGRKGMLFFVCVCMVLLGLVIVFVYFYWVYVGICWLIGVICSGIGFLSFVLVIELIGFLK